MSRIYHIIYQTENLVNGKIYIGKHTTRNLEDGYIGSGVALKKAIDKHGIENFLSVPIFFAFTEAQAYAVEAEIVNIDFVLRNDTYNQIVGGYGLSSGEAHPCYGKSTPLETRLKMSIAGKGKAKTLEHRENIRKGKLGVPRSEESRIKQGESRKGHVQDEEWVRKRIANQFGRKQSEETITKRLTKIDYSKRTNFYNITSPEGIVYQNSKSLQKFCEEHGLSINVMRKWVDKGEIKISEGARRTSPESKKTIGWTIESIIHPTAMGAQGRGSSDR